MIIIRSTRTVASQKIEICCKIEDFENAVFWHIATLAQLHMVMWAHTAVIIGTMYRLSIPLYRTRLENAYLPQYAVDRMTPKWSDTKIGQNRFLPKKTDMVGKILKNFVCGA